MIHDDETVSWIHYPLEDSFEKDFCSNFFSELPSCDPIEVDKPIRHIEEEKLSKLNASDTTHVLSTSQHHKLKPSNGVPCPENHMPPPRLHYSNSSQQNQNLGSLGKVVNFSQFSAHGKCDLRSSTGQQLAGKEAGTQGEIKECSVMTVGLSHCGSNQLPADLDVSWVSSNNGDGNTSLSAGAFKGNVKKIMPQSESGKTETLEPTVTSPSGGSGSSFGRPCKQSTATTSGNNNNKRKSIDVEELECQSEVKNFCLLFAT